MDTYIVPLVTDIDMDMENGIASFRFPSVPTSVSIFYSQWINFNVLGDDKVWGVQPSLSVTSIGI